MKVVVIDDDSYDRKVICDSLARDNYEVIEAADGVSGLEIIQRENPDLIICDMKMPLMNGDELLEIIRNSDHSIGITPFILISGFITNNDKMDRLRNGADNCFEKPVDLELLSAYVKSNLIGMERISNYMKTQLDSIALSISETVNNDFNAYKSMTSNIDQYSETIVNALKHRHKNEGEFPNKTSFNHIDYMNFFLQEHSKRKLLVETTNGEDLSWLLIFLVAKAHIKGEFFVFLSCGEKLKVSRSYGDVIRQYFATLVI